MDQGGHLVCVGEFPYLDDGLRPYNALNVQEPAGIVSGAPGNWSLALCPGGKARILFECPLASSWLYNYDTVPGEPIVATRLPVDHVTAEENLLQANLEVGTTYTIGYTQAMGQGQLTVIGLEPSPALLLALHDAYDVPIPVHSSTSGIKTTIFQRNNAYYLIAIDTGTEGKAAEIILHPQQFPAGHYTVRHLLTERQEEQPLNGRLYLNIPAKDDTAVRLAPIG